MGVYSKGPGLKIFKIVLTANDLIAISLITKYPASDAHNILYMKGVCYIFEEDLTICLKNYKNVGFL